ncbi:MAG: NAD(P)/FAD-dependent oxidoreductase [Bacteroidetes bacterium]|nr:NAD(P)/FAD-dependent oxidoreductase [Bacteroidota bacterium]
MNPHLIIIGGGAAGIFCAVNAARLCPGLKVTVIEKSAKLLAKVKVSGGGRCNVTHDLFEADAFSRQYPRGERFVRKAFYQFFATDTIQWFEERGVSLHNESDGRIFPTTNDSQTIIDCLLKEANKFDVSFLMQTEVKNIVRHEQWQLTLKDNDTLNADFICIATGGSPKKDGYNWLASLGHSIIDPVPSLFTFQLPDHPIRSLMGVSVKNVSVKIMGEKLKENGPLLITHWGFSGPVILRLSAWGARMLQEKQYHFTIVVNWLQDMKEEQLKSLFLQQRQENGAKKIHSGCPFELPSRLWIYFLNTIGIEEDLRWADLTIKQQQALTQLLIAGEYIVAGKTTFKEEFVTAGGIDLRQINPATMESKLHEGLFFAGEVMDVDGITGGFNFQHAWTSGMIVAASVAARLNTTA